MVLHDRAVLRHFVSTVEVKMREMPPPHEFSACVDHAGKVD